MTVDTDSTTTNAPPGPDGWTYVPTQYDGHKYVTDDRESAIICKLVTTHSGDAVSCRLYEGDDPYALGTPVTSVMVENVSEIPEGIAQLEAEL